MVDTEDGEDHLKRKEAASYLFSAVSNVLEATVQNETEEASDLEVAQVRVVIKHVCCLAFTCLCKSCWYPCSPVMRTLTSTNFKQPLE